MDIEPSQPWQRTIEVALGSCDVLVAYVTPDFAKSRWTDQEVGWVLGRGAPVLSVSAGQQPYGFFGSFQSTTAGEQPMGAIGHSVFRAIVVSTLRERIAEDPTIAALVARTVVSSFCASPSFDSTRRRFEHLSLIPLSEWTDEMLQALQAAKESNNQINQAFLSKTESVPDAIDELVRRVTTSRQS
jgi:hypothetical protein